MVVVVFIGFFLVEKLTPSTLLSAGSWHVGKKKEEGN